jgi:hypothetical protein
MEDASFQRKIKERRSNDMAVLKNRTQDNFTIISNKMFHDKKLSMRDRGILSMLCSLPDGWEFSIAGLSAISEDGKDSIRTSIHKLEEAGYLRRAMSKSSMLKEGMKGGLNGLLSSTKKPSKEQIVTETTPAPPVSVSETTEVPVHCNFLINKSIHTRMKYLAIKKGMSLRDIVNEAMTEYLKRHDT